MKRLILCLLVLILVLSNASATAQGYTAGDTAASVIQKGNFTGTVVLGRPSGTEITASILSDKTTQVFLEWAVAGSNSLKRSLVAETTAGKPAVIVMDGLLPNREHSYRIYYKALGMTQFEVTEPYVFMTSRGLEQGFTFTIQSDSHLLNKADKALYMKSMQTMAAMKPDFLIDMGDTFLNDQKSKAEVTKDVIWSTSVQQRQYFDPVTRSAPLFLVIGNHEGEYGYVLDQGNENIAALSTAARTTLYPNPMPNSFYSGNETVPKDGQHPQNYYAYTWGDALFVAIDPYRYTLANPYSQMEGWDWTLGKAQYDWFKAVLSTSKAKYKFVFAHHAIGNIRGGESVAKLYEWGGYDKNGQYLFDSKRSGWGKPIHQIMKDAGVTVFFQGHDHLFARESVDGIVYQTLPKPAEVIPDAQSNYNAYPEADVLMNSGFLKVDVTSSKATISYYRNYYVSTDSQAGNTGIVYSYTVTPQHQVTVTHSQKDNLATYGSVAKAVASKGESSNAAIGQTIRLMIDQKEVVANPSPFMDATNRVMVPLRIISEALGNSAVWEAKGTGGTIAIQGAKSTVLLTIGEKTASVNGSRVALDAPAMVVEGRAFVPIRFVADVLGAKVTWDQKSRTVTILKGSSESTATTQSVSQGVVLGAPTATSIGGTLMGTPGKAMKIVYGTDPKSMTKTWHGTVDTSGVLHFELTSLLASQHYSYSIYQDSSDASSPPISSGSFTTQRSVGTSYSFAIQADPHMDENSDLQLYANTLRNIALDQPDFLIDLGDTFMGEKLGRTQEGIHARYLDNRSYFSISGNKVPLLLVNGNHDGENGWNIKSGAIGIPDWTLNNRYQYFANPVNGTFYSASSKGKGNYYAFNWGDAQFIVLDPFWFSSVKPSSDAEGWRYTLGQTQYDWLKQTLAVSKATYKFVFIHNLVGGYTKDGRGGAEAAEFFEWGGKNSDGTEGFKQNRPNFELPIHQLLVKYGVNAVFHGHDHFYAKQVKDGIVYQLVPQPSHPGTDVRNAAQYSYLSGTLLPPAGHLLVTVSPAKVDVKYVQSTLKSSSNRQIADQYVLQK